MTLKKPTLPLLFALTLAAALAPATHAQSFKVVHNFTGNADGANPQNGFLMDSAGNMYGTASAGGAYKNGTVFEITAAGKWQYLHTFRGGADGENPQGALLQDSAGNLYGTTLVGGVYGGGTVYRISGTTESVLHAFGAPGDGSAPVAGLALDAAGNLYGTTSAGGRNGGGTVFILSPNGATWRERIIHNFGSGTDGSAPVAGVTLDAAGNLLGTTSAGGSHGYGIVFLLTKANSWARTILHEFADLDDGAVPYAGLVPGPSGTFFGAATEGGVQGGGTVFKLTPSGSKWQFSVLSSLPGWGISGSFRNVLLDSSGAIYATTHCDGNYSSGTVFQLVPVGNTWDYTLLYTFTGQGDGLFSFSNLVLRNGKLYGTTKVGGTLGNGVIFEVTP